jgi:hypothetical protein
MSNSGVKYFKTIKIIDKSEDGENREKLVQFFCDV